MSTDALWKKWSPAHELEATKWANELVLRDNNTTAMGKNTKTSAATPDLPKKPHLHQESIYFHRLVTHPRH